MADEYEKILEQVRRKRGDFEASQDEVEQKKSDYFDSVWRLHEAGMPLREIANELGLSHQRVHQMVDAASGKKESRLKGATGRIAKQGGLAALLLLAMLGGYAAWTDVMVTDTRVASVPSPSGTVIEKPDLGRQGWHLSTPKCKFRLKFGDKRDARVFRITGRPGTDICFPDPQRIFKEFEKPG